MRIVSVLAHKDDAVDGKTSRSERERVRDTFCDRHIVSLCEALTYIARMRLIHPEGGNFKWRFVVFVVNPVAFEKPSDEVVRVRADVICGRQAGDALFTGL